MILGNSYGNIYYFFKTRRNVLMYGLGITLELAKISTNCNSHLKQLENNLRVWL